MIESDANAIFIRAINKGADSETVISFVRNDDLSVSAACIYEQLCQDRSYKSFSGFDLSEAEAEALHDWLAQHR